MSERCERTSEWMSEWPTVNSPISRCPESLCVGLCRVQKEIETSTGRMRFTELWSTEEIPFSPYGCRLLVKQEEKQNDNFKNKISNSSKRKKRGMLVALCIFYFSLLVALNIFDCSMLVALHIFSRVNATLYSTVWSVCRLVGQ